MSIKFRNVLNEKLKDPDFKKEFEALEPEYSALRTIIEARKAQDFTQKELSKFLHDKIVDHQNE